MFGMTSATGSATSTGGMFGMSTRTFSAKEPHAWQVPLRVDVARPTELGPAELAQWRTFQRQDRRLANPFLAPEFAVAVGRNRPDVRVAVLTDGPGTVGFLPYQRGPLGISRAIGYRSANRQGLVHAPGMEWSPHDLLRRCGVAVWEFDNLVGHQVAPFQPRHAHTGVAPFVDLSPGWTTWLAAKRSAGSTVKKVQQNQRKLGREAGGEVSFDFHAPDRDTLKLLMRWKSEQYRRTGRPDRFAMPWFVAAVEELTGQSTADFAGVLAVLRVRDRPIAVQQALSANGTLSCWIPAYDVGFAPYSPGLVCMLELVRAAMERGFTEIDLAKGHADYKEAFKDGEHAVSEGWVERPSAAATLRRLQTAPRRRVVAGVLARPRLRQAARAGVHGLGRVRLQLRHLLHP